MAVKEMAEFEVVVKDDIGQRFHHSEHFTISTLLNKHHIVNINPGNSSMEGILTSIRFVIIIISDNETYPPLTKKNSPINNNRVTALQPGDAILQVSVSEKDVKPTFIRLRVGEELSPSSSILHIGCDTSFSVPSSSTSSTFSWGGGNVRGTWWSSNEGVVNVGERGGVVGSGVGKGRVFYDGEGFVFCVFYFGFFYPFLIHSLDIILLLLMWFKLPPLSLMEN